MKKSTELLEHSIESIECMTELLYQQKKKESYIQVDITLKLLIELVHVIAKNKEEGIKTPIDEIRLMTILAEAMKAMEQKDEVLLSDIFEYELKELLVECLENIKMEEV